MRYLNAIVQCWGDSLYFHFLIYQILRNLQLSFSLQQHSSGYSCTAMLKERHHLTTICLILLSHSEYVGISLVIDKGTGHLSMRRKEGQ